MIVEDLLRCTTSHGEFAVRSRDVRHVARAEQLRMDDVADGRVGALRLGNQIVPVFSLDHALGLGGRPATADADQHIAVTGEASTLIGWLVDKLTREPATNVKMAPMPPFVGGHACRWFEGVVTCANGDLVLLIDPRELSPLRDHVFAGDRSEPALLPAVVAQPSSADPVALVFSTAVFPASTIDKFALSGRQVAAIVQPTQTIAVPGCASHVAGLTLWRDAVVPVVDYRADNREQPAHWRRLIARCGARAQSLIAFAIDDQVLMHRPAADNLMVDGACPPFASAVFDVNGDHVALLDVDALADG
jgi:chemotaxis signal transduction protein